MKIGIAGPNKGPGQLGMLLAHAANNIHCLGETNLKILTIGDGITPDWSDEHYGLTETEIKEFNDFCQIIIFETESISDEYRNSFKDKLIPSREALNIFRNRIHEKEFFQKLDFNTPNFFVIDSESSLRKTIDTISSLDSYQGRLKTAEFGYDGHGQKQINSWKDLENAWKILGKVDCVLEEEINLYQELSVIVSRFKDGRCLFYPIPQNEHQNGILYRSKTSNLDEEEIEDLYLIAQKIVDELNYVGTFCLETFQVKGFQGGILLNEAAPRVHNSGHYSLSACESTNQFDSHIRAVCNLNFPMSVETNIKNETFQVAKLNKSYFSMTNILGVNFSCYQEIKNQIESSELFNKEDIEWSFIWYGKNEAKTGRKMGHLTITTNDMKLLEESESLVDQLLENIAE
ncbi:MAG: ATP-grasp domain-containing protein [Candidatus Caenarcaniphilales bacterium]|nr:ATP-grasp domain-containing protein [Candidatus Caenarcaniphilales bacterium]